MAHVHASFTVGDYDQWKTMFDGDPAGRKQSGSQGYRISRGVDDPNQVTIDVDFPDSATAQQVLDRLRQVWDGAPAGSIKNPVGMVMEVAEEGAG